MQVLVITRVILSVAALRRWYEGWMRGHVQPPRGGRRTNPGRPSPLLGGFYFKLARVRALVIAFAFCACGGRTELHGTGMLDGGADDAAPADFLSCGDASCDTQDSYCRILTENGTTTRTCTPLPAKCHTCDCSNIPKPGLTCVCSSTGQQITISCN